MKSTSVRAVATGPLAAALSVAAGTQAYGNIIYSGIQNIPVGPLGPVVPIDIDGGGIPDLLFRNSSPTPGAYSLRVAPYFTLSNTAVAGYTGTFLIAPPQNAASFLASSIPVDSTNLGFVGSLPQGPAGKTDVMMGGVLPGPAFTGPWPASATGLLGIRFGTDAGFQPHFAWARVSVNSATFDATVIDWAYESNAGQAIHAGQTIPEPSTLMGMVAGAASILALRRRRKKS